MIDMNKAYITPPAIAVKHESPIRDREQVGDGNQEGGRLDWCVPHDVIAIREKIAIEKRGEC